MIDVSKILKRSWNILWNYRLLWVFGFLLALTMGSGNANTFQYTFGSQDRPMYNFEPYKTGRASRAIPSPRSCRTSSARWASPWTSFSACTPLSSAWPHRC